MSPIASLPANSGRYKSFHDVGGVFTCLVSYTSTVPPVMNTTYWLSLSKARGEMSFALLSLLRSMTSSSFSFFSCVASELSM